MLLVPTSLVRRFRSICERFATAETRLEVIDLRRQLAEARRELTASEDRLEAEAEADLALLRSELDIELEVSRRLCVQANLPASTALTTRTAIHAERSRDGLRSDFDALVSQLIHPSQGEP